MTELATHAEGATLTLHLGALRRNYRALRAMADGAEVAGIVKANAYGLGLEPVATALLAEGCRTFFVAQPGEAIKLRDVAPDADIYVLNGLLPGTPPLYAKHRLRAVLGSLDEIDEWAGFCRATGFDGAAALHVDTGMNRLGLDMAEATRLAEPGHSNTGIDELGFRPTLLMTHLACADEADHPLTARQLARFQALRPLFAGIPASFSNSAGLALGDAARFDMVRPGIALYGGRFHPSRAPLEAVVSLTAPVIVVRDVKGGDRVGYGSTWTAKSACRIAIVSVGYADGYHRRASWSDQMAGGKVVVNDVLCPLAGRISMDLMAVDVTTAGDVQRGTLATLLGPQWGINEAAETMGTISYEVLTSLGARYARLTDDA